MEDDDLPRRRHRLRRVLLAGAVALFPIVATVAVVWFVVERTAGALVRVLKHVPGLGDVPYPLMLLFSGLFLLAVVYVAGVVATNYFGKRALSLVDGLMAKLPLVRSIYGASRKITDTIASDDPAFKRVVLVQFPQRGSFAVAFVTTAEKWDIGGRPYVNVFVPTTPNPTSGWLLILPEDETHPLNMSVNEGLMMVVSGGTVLKDEHRKYLASVMGGKR